MGRRFPLHPAHPERVCWGCERYCAADSMRCGNGSERSQHPCELLGDDWIDFGLDAQRGADSGADAVADPSASAPVTRAG